MELTDLIAPVMHSGVVGSVFFFFMKQHQKSLRSVEDKILIADLPKLQKNLEKIQNDFAEHKLEDNSFHVEFRALLKERLSR